MAIRNLSEAKPKKKKIYISNFIWVFLVVAVAVFGFGKMYVNYQKTKQFEAEIADVEQQIENLNAQSAEIEKILQDDDHLEYFEKIAREKYGYCKPGEKVYYNSLYGE